MSYPEPGAHVPCWNCHNNDSTFFVQIESDRRIVCRRCGAVAKTTPYVRPPVPSVPAQPSPRAARAWRVLDATSCHGRGENCTRYEVQGVRIRHARDGVTERYDAKSQRYRQVFGNVSTWTADGEVTARAPDGAVRRERFDSVELWPKSGYDFEKGFNRVVLFKGRTEVATLDAEYEPFTATARADA